MNELRKSKFYRIIYINIFLIALFIILFTSSIMAVNQDVPLINISIPHTVAALPLFWILENNMLDFDADVTVSLFSDHQQALSLIAQDELDIIITEVNAGARAFNQGVNVKLLNINIWSIDHLLTYGYKANSWEDLKGKRVGLPLQSEPTDFLFRYLLLNNGVKPDELDFVYEQSQVGIRMFQLGLLDSIILPEPLLTTTYTNTEQAYISMNLQEEWGKIHNGDQRIPLLGLFVRGSFARRNRELVENINHYYQQGVEWVNSNPQEAAEMAERYLGIPVMVTKESLARIDLNIYSQYETFRLINLFFREVLTIYPEMIGGKLPNEFFYF